MPAAFADTPTETAPELDEVPSGLTLTPDILERLGIAGPQAGQSFSIRFTVDSVGPEGASISPVDGSAVEDMGEPMGSGDLEVLEGDPAAGEMLTPPEDEVGGGVPLAKKLPPSQTIDGSRKAKRMSPKEAMGSV